MVQHVLLARQLNQPAQHLPLKGLSPQQQSQVLSQYNHDQQRPTAPMASTRLSQITSVLSSHSDLLLLLLLQFQSCVLSVPAVLTWNACGGYFMSVLMCCTC